MAASTRLRIPPNRGNPYPHTRLDQIQPLLTTLGDRRRRFSTLHGPLHGKLWADAHLVSSWAPGRAIPRTTPRQTPCTGFRAISAAWPFGHPHRQGSFGRAHTDPELYRHPYRRAGGVPCLVWIPEASAPMRPLPLVPRSKSRPVRKSAHDSREALTHPGTPDIDGQYRR